MDEIDISYKWAEYIHKAKYEDLPSHIVDLSKKGILDMLACILAGSPSDEAGTALKMVRRWGGREECTVFVHGDKLPLPSAAYINTWIGRARDFGSIPHVDERLVPAMLTLADYRGGVDGRTFLLAHALIHNLNSRLLIASRASASAGHARASTDSIAFCAAGRMLGFDEEKILNTMGFGFQFGSQPNFSDPPSHVEQPMRDALMARNSVYSIVLAEQGFQSNRNFLEGKRLGFYRIYANDEYNRDVLTKGLGTLFDLNKEFGYGYDQSTYYYKPFPTCSWNHAPVDRLLEILGEHPEIRPEDVGELTVEMTPGIEWIWICQGKEDGQPPKTVIEALFHLPYALAVTLVKRRQIELDELTDEALKDPKLIETCRKVKCRAVPLEAPSSPARFGYQGVSFNLILNLKNGKTYRVSSSLRDWRDTSMEDIKRKFRRSAKFGARMIPEENVERVIEMVDTLEKADDVTELVRLITP